MVRLPNLLNHRFGRLGAFFGLYVCEGLPQGFTGTAVALEFKRMGMHGNAIAACLATIMLPWTWKWIMGPLVDNLHLKRFGRRKQWIVLTQVGMILTLITAILFMPHSVTDADGNRAVVGLQLFTIILLAHNIFAASQDVAIDALACNTLAEHERGLANGLMFAGAQAGAAIGGSGVLYLKSNFAFQTAAMVVPLLLMGVLTMVVLLISDHVSRQPHAKSAPIPTIEHGRSFQLILREIVLYIKEVIHVFFFTRRGFLGLILALIPFGGMALSLTVSTVLTPTLGMTDSEIASLGLASSLVFTVCCMSGGFLSDRFGRRLTLAVFSLGTLIPTAWMGWRLHAEGWTYPTESSSGIWPRHEDLISAWWIASLVYSVFQGLMYGIRTAFYMDIVEPRIAATHFTACMALINVVTIYSYWWQGAAITPKHGGGWGLTYLQIFLTDAALGALFVFLLPFVKPRPPRHVPEVKG